MKQNRSRQSLGVADRPASPLIGAQVPGWLKALGRLAIGSNEGEPEVVIPKELRRPLRELVDVEDSVR